MADDDLEKTAEQIAYEAKEVLQFLKHPAVLKAFAATELRIHRQWETAGDPLSREMCWHKLQAFKELRQQLRAHGDTPLTLS